MPAVVEILQGSQSAIERAISTYVPTDVLCIRPPAAPKLPWAAVRLLVAALRGPGGSPELDAALQSEAAQLSLVLRGLAGPAGDDPRNHHQSAQELGFLSHNMSQRLPLEQAWLRALGPQLHGRTLVFPELARLDVESIRWLWRLLVECPAASLPRLVFGHDPQALPTATNQRSLEQVTAFLDMLIAGDGTQIRTLSDTSAGTDAPEPPQRWDVLDDQLELRAWDQLRAGGEKRGPALLMQALGAAFGCFGFCATLDLGLRVLEKASDALSAAERCRAHTLVALAAYNRQVQSFGDTELALLIDRHLRAALRLETDAGRRCHLLYRLSINEGRRLGRIESALRLANQGVETAQTADLPPGLAAFLEAWSRSGRAYLHARRRDLPAALHDCERAYALLDAPELPGAPDCELAFSVRVMLDNLIEVQLRRKDTEQAERLIEQIERKELDMPGVPRLSRFRRIALGRLQGRLDLAVGYARMLRQELAQRLDPVHEDLVCVELGDLAYRIGDLALASESFQHSLKIRLRIGDRSSQRHALVHCALCSWRQGQPEEAIARLARAQTLCGADEPAAHAELLALAARIEAENGADGKAERRINRAIELAVEVGERDLLLSIARSAGWASLALGRETDAQQAFAQASELAEAEGPAPPAPLLFATLVGQGICGVLDRGALLQAVLPHLARALDEDADAWWLLPRLLALLKDRLKDLPATPAGARLLSAARQRADCRVLLSELRSRG